jgi:transcriptional regulator with XRE-family HTH domain
MQYQLGGLLRDWRAARQLSLSALAARASVHKATLSRWETGASLPRLPELEAALAALDASPAQWEQALSLIHAPRAQRMRATRCAFILGTNTAAPPVPGHLLRAMRQRRGLSLEEVARRLRVQASTVSRWEQSASAPTAERLQALLDLLGARPQERAALADRRLLLAPLSPSVPASLDGLFQQFEALKAQVLQGERHLMDLEFLDWEARLWPLASRSASGQELLAQGWSSYAVWLSWDDRKREAGQYARRVLDLARGAAKLGPGVLAAVQEAIHVSGLILAWSGSRTGPARAVNWLRVWRSAGSGPRWEIPFYREMGDYAWYAGQGAAALSFANHARRLAEQAEDPSALRLCQGVQVDLLVRAGRAREALPLLSSPDDYSLGLARLLETLRWVKVLRALGEPSASDWLNQAYSLIERYRYPNFRKTADELAREC